MFEQFEFVQLIGSAPFNNFSLAGSSARSTVKMAKECDVYILILSEKYGMELDNGKSATEVEYDAAILDDPTKVMIFKKNTVNQVEKKQQDFIAKVSNYYSGYFRASFNYSHELQQVVKNSFFHWLSDRTQVENNLNIIDHYIRVIKGIIDLSVGEIFYKTTKEDVEIEFSYNGTDYSFLCRRTEIRRNFWASVNEFQKYYTRIVGE